MRLGAGVGKESGVGMGRRLTGGCRLEIDQQQF